MSALWSLGGNAGVSAGAAANPLRPREACRLRPALRTRVEACMVRLKR